MALNINGTTGISGVDGSASAPALQGTDSNTGINFGSDTVNINTGGSTRATIDSSGALDVPSNFPIKVAGSEKLRITSSGNLGISTTSPVAQTTAGGTAITPVLDLKGTSGNNTSGVLQLTRKDNATQGSCIYSSGDDAGLTFRNTDGNGFGFYNGTTRAIRINPSSNIFIHSENSSGSNGRIYTNGTNGGTSTVLEVNQNAGSGTEMITFRNSGSQLGTIHQSGSGVSYQSNSDYRLKENDVVISNGITRLKQLRPIRFNWKVDTETVVDGFYAHEVSAVVPEAVRGNKDEVFDTDGVGTQVKGDPKYQQLEQSKLVPLLTAALQEAITKIETLETKVAALEAG